MNSRFTIACIVAVFFFAVSASGLKEYSYGRAIATAQKSHWKEAKDQLEELIVDEPNRPDLLYDTGVLSYRLKDFSTAEHYFKQAMQSDICPVDLKGKAHFNLANSLVEQKKLERALEEYQKIVCADPGNKEAAHNMACVKQMLERQEQEQSIDQKDTENKTQNNNKHATTQPNRDNKADVNQNDSSQPNSTTSENNGTDDAQKQRDDSNEKHNETQSKASDQRDNQQEDSNNKSVDENFEGNKSKSDQQQNNSENGQHGRSGKDTNLDKLNTVHDKDIENKNQEQAGQLVSNEKENTEAEPAWLTDLLEKQERVDAHANKQFIRRAISKNLGGQNGLSRW